MKTDAFLPQFLDDTSLKLVFFGGKGGVGKTTCACATALTIAARRPAQSFLLVSTDPAHSLLGVLAGQKLPPNLEVQELDAAASLRAFQAKHGSALKEIAERGTFLDQEDLKDLMNLSLPGMDELAAYLDVADWLKQGRYDCIVVDTAPTGHTLRLLEMPDLIRRWLTALDSLLAKHRYIRRHFAGDARVDHLDRFLLDMDDSLKALEKLMKDRTLCRFVLITLAEPLSMDESVDLALTLSKLHIPMTDLVVNRMLPVNDCPNCQAGRNRQLRVLKGAAERLREPRFWILPLFAEEPQGVALYHVWSQGRSLDMIPPVSPPGNDLPMRVEDAAPLPAATLRLLLFAGKGGVGKTTMACATALRLHSEHSSLRVLLFSADPAHSLSDCLGVAVTNEPTPILPGLNAQEIDAEADFAQIREAYREELEAFLTESLPHLDITFDREVMEHLLDLAPPGLDEIMALTAVSEHLGSGCYDVVILDAAPSGHLIRLLQLPELIGEWLKLFFSLLLKYRRVMRLPRLSERLVKLSRELKSLRALLRDPAQTALYIVTIPTHLAVEKTAEMADALHRLGVNAHALFINQITPPSGCQLCSALNKREAAQIKRARTIFAHQAQTRIFRQADPGGIRGLTELGCLLYRQPMSARKYAGDDETSR